MPSQPRAGRIWVMDDEPLILQTTCEMLEFSGYEAIPFSNGDQLLVHLIQADKESRAPDLVIMDLNIPKGMGGLACAQKIREFNTTLPIILSSGYSSDEALLHPEAHGVNEGLKKPFRRAELLQIVTKWISHPLST